MCSSVGDIVWAINRQTSRLVYGVVDGKILNKTSRFYYNSSLRLIVDEQAYPKRSKRYVTSARLIQERQI